MFRAKRLVMSRPEWDASSLMILGAFGVRARECSVMNDSTQRRCRAFKGELFVISGRSRANCGELPGWDRKHEKNHNPFCGTATLISLLGIMVVAITGRLEREHVFG